MATTSIEWAETVWNPVTGCTRVSAGCDHCYAAKMTHRLEHMGEAKYRGLTVLNARGERHFNGVVRTHDDALRIPLKWRKPRRVFVNSMSDLFHRDVPFEFIDQVFAVMALCQQHTFMVLTKRPERMARYFNTRRPRWYQVVSDWLDDGCAGFLGKAWDACHAGIARSDITRPLPNVWAGTSVEDQNAANARIPHLRKVPAAVRFLSCEPLLSGLNLLCSQHENQRAGNTGDVCNRDAVDGRSGPSLAAPGDHSRECNRGTRGAVPQTTR